MPTLSAPVVYYIELEAVYWAVTVDGNWVVVSPDQLQANVPIYSLTLEQIISDDNGEFSIVINGNEIAIPANVSSNLPLTEEAAAADNGRNRSNESDSAYDQPEGLNFIFQVVQSQNPSVIANSGFETQGDLRDDDDNNSFNAIAQDTFIPITLTVEFIDIDGYINQYEAPSVTLKGQAIGAGDGQILELIITDSEGQQQAFEVVAQDQQWQLTDVDFQSFAEGDLSATITAITYPGEVNDGLDTSIKDTLAQITIGVDSGGDNVINAQETPVVDLSGVVENIEDGQTVTVTATDINGLQLVLVTEVVNGGWLLADQDLSSLADGPLDFSVSSQDIAGNITEAIYTVDKDSQARITIAAVDNDGVLNQQEVSKSVLAGVVDNVEDGRGIAVTVTDVDGTTLTFSSEIINGAWQLDNVDLSLLAEGELTLTAETSDIAGNTAIASNVVVKDTLASVTIEIVDNDSVINSLEQQAVTMRGTVSNIEDGQVVTVTLSDGTGNSRDYSAVITAGEWQLTDVDLSGFADGSLTATANVSDLAGNSASATDSILVDILAEITIEVNAGSDSVINAAEMVMLDLSGTVTDIEEGQGVTITVTDINDQQLSFSTTVVAGAWQINDADISSLSDGDLSFVASSSDVAGNLVDATVVVNKDSLASISVEIVDNDAVINALEQQAVTVRGTVNNIEDGQTVNILLSDGSGNSQTYTAIVAGGAWQLTNVDLTGFEDGSLTATVDVTDLAGNSATASDTIAVDILAAITIAVETGTDTVLNGSESSQVDLSGTVTDIEDGQTIIVIVTDINGLQISLVTRVVGSGWSLVDQDLSILADGPLTFEVNASDIAGNIVSAIDNAYKETLAEITIEAVDNDGVLNQNEVGLAVLAGQVISVEDGRPVEVTVTDVDSNSLTFTSVILNGAWVLNGVDLSSLAEGELTLTAVTSDFEGNIASGSNSVVKDTLASVTIEIIDNDDVINSLEQQAVTVRGTVSNIEDGQTVTVTLSDGSGNSLDYSAVIAAGAWQLTELDLSGFADGSLTATANVSDLAGNSASATDTILVDILASITIEVNAGADSVINAAEMVILDLTGTVTDIEEGQSVTITVTDINDQQLSFTTTVSAGAWQINGADISSLSDGDLTFVASSSDVAGNLVDASVVVNKDSLASITIEIVDADGLISTAESTAETLTGTVTNIEDGRPVEVTVTDINGLFIILNTVVVDGLWQIENVDLSTLADGELLLQASSSDLAGNPAVATNTTILDTQVSIDIDTGVDGFDAGLFMYGVQDSLSGVTTGVEEGQSVDLTITDGITTKTFTSVVATDGSWQFTGLDVSGLDRNLGWSMEVVVVDASGNSASDVMPTLFVPEIASLYELVLNAMDSTSVTIPVEIADAVLTLTAEQNRLLALTSEGQDLSIDVAADGLSFTLTRDGDSEIVMTASLAATELTVTLFQPLDERNQTNVLSYIRLSGLQTDSDGTTEEIITYAVLNFMDTRAFAFDDSATLVEDTTANGSLLGNDYTIEGPLTVTSINYNGTDYSVAAGAPAIIVTAQGTITIQANGSWSFEVADNLDNNQLQEMTLVYSVLDSDGSIDTANAVFTVVDGVQGAMSDVVVSFQEADIDQAAQVTQQVFSIVAGSDTLVADSVSFSVLTPYLVRNQALTSHGNALVYSLSSDGKTLTATTNESTPVTVFTIELSATNVGDDLSVTATFTQFEPLDHLRTDVLNIDTYITAEDLDGTQIDQGVLSWAISDGNDPQLVNITSLSFEENALAGTPLTQSGSFDLQVGSDAVVAVAFSPAASQPELTASGVPIQYSLSAGGLILIAHLGDEADPVFVIELSDTWSPDSDSLSQNYDFTLYQAFDQIGTDSFDFNIFTADRDGDVSPATLTVIVADGDAASIDNVSLTVSEDPSITAYNTVDAGEFNVTATKDSVIDIAFNMVDGSEVQNSSGTALTQNGEPLYWQIKDEGAVLEAVTADGLRVFSISLPTDIEITPETAGTVAVTFEMLGPIDHLGSADLLDTLNVAVNITDSDNTISSAELAVTIYDGDNAKLATPLQLNINEGNLTTTNPISTSQLFSLVEGSDSVVEVALTDSFSFGTYYSAGQLISLNTTADGNGWYVATRAGDNETVFQIRFSANGQVEYRQYHALDHADANGENSLDLQFEVYAIDADNDKSASQMVTVTVNDDVPEDTAKTLEFFEGDNDSYNVQMFSQAQQGADGASVTNVIYKGTSYAVGSVIELYTDANPAAVKYGELVVDENGLATVTTLVFAYNDLSYSEDVLLEVTDADGDVATDTLTLIAKDQAGSVRVSPTDFVEDTLTGIDLEATPGDVDANELITSIVFDSAALQGGLLILNAVEVPKDADGNYILSLLNGGLSEDPVTRVATPNGTLSFLPYSNSSDATDSVEFIITVNITGKTPLTTTLPVSVESVADTPEWDTDSEFLYTVDEDGGSVNMQLNATSGDQAGIDDRGSETVSYIIDSISAGLTLTTAGRTISDGMTISQVDLDNLIATAGDNLAGQFTFTVQAKSTESDNNDTALSSIETVTIDVTPIADVPTLTTKNIHSVEDAPILLNAIISGKLTDNSGSEILNFELTLPDGWSIDSPSAASNGNVWTVLASEVDSGVAQLIPADDVSSANFGDFSIAVRSFSLDTAQDGIDPADDTTNPNPNYSDVDFVSVSLTGVANDAPIIDGDPNVWTIDNATGVISNVNPFAEDNLIPLDFTIVTSDDDGSEALDLRLSGLPEGVIFVDSLGNPVNLPVVGFDNGLPLYGVSAASLSTLSIQAIEDFSGIVSFSIFAQSTELDGDTAAFELTVNIDIDPVIDTGPTTLETTSYGFENRAIPVDFTPILDADLDGSETITDLIILYQDPQGFILTMDGSQIFIPEDGLSVLDLLDGSSPTIDDLLNSGRLAVVPPLDADGSFDFKASYRIADTSESGVEVQSYELTQLTVVVDAVVNLTTNLQSEAEILVSSDGSPIDLTGQVLFFEGDIDGSEVLDYIVITVPSGDGWYVSHPNGAINDGEGRWLIPVAGITSDTVQEYALDVLAGVTIQSEVATGPALINVEGRVLDRDDPAIIETSFYVQFDQDAPASNATVVDMLQLTTVDGIEDTTIDFSGHLNLSITTDPNDVVSFRVLTADLPQGGYFTGSDVQAIYDESGENIIEYLFTTDSLGSLQLHNINEDFAGEFSIPIRIIATDPISGDTIIDDTQIIDIEILPVADGVSLDVVNQTMLEDGPIPLGLRLVFEDPHMTPTTGGSEQILLGDGALPVTLTLLDGGSLSDSLGLWTLQAGSTDTWAFSGTTMDELNNSLLLLEFVPPLHLSGDFRLLFAATSIDTATINGSDVTDQASFDNTFTIEVTPVTDAAETPSEQIIVKGQEDTLIDLSALDASSLGLIDQDGSEEIYLTIRGVPSGSVLYYQDGTDLIQLPNVGADGGNFNGSPTYAWSVTSEQLAGLVFLPPSDFSGDIPLSIQAITQELGTDDFVTSSTDILVGVSPVADGVDLITPPESLYSSVEDEVITIDLDTALKEVDGSELITMRVVVTSDDASALVGLEGVKIGNQFISFKYDDVNDNYYATLTALSSLTQFELYPGDLAFGTLDVQLELTSLDVARVLGGLESDFSDATVVNFEVEISPQVDAPVWTQVADVTANDVNNVALNLGLALQNPAFNESGQLTIYGVPDDMSLSEGVQTSDAWVVSLERVEFITVVGAEDGDVFTLTLEPTAVLAGETAEGAVETITVTVDLAAPSPVSAMSVPITETQVSPLPYTLQGGQALDEELKQEALLEAKYESSESELSLAIKQSFIQSTEADYLSTSLDQNMEYSASANDLLARLDDEMALVSLQP
ncbi:Ig-like domain-containing protein [Shewanella sp. Isolate11]|uniref:T1SS-143 repeat domain-containing protein n=1 Tax=Shewanella sp. Isolate11 TaxID=2908530 RepID=UPI001EFECA60|nr:Ig-like domain-containing protein [Shewanella sp. Isolate11]MCG9698427.1 Ig-like domain-containing protein [Shewanella sp. Isolate11]